MKNKKSFQLALLLTLLLIFCPLCGYDAYHVASYQASLIILSITILIPFLKKLLKFKLEQKFLNIRLKRFKTGSVFD
jgi:hypothetical protein